MHFLGSEPSSRAGGIQSYATTPYDDHPPFDSYFFSESDLPKQRQRIIDVL
jgi:hypothetical protein